MAGRRPPLVDAVRRGSCFIDLAIAVVVLAIADFGGRADASVADEVAGALGVAREHTRSALTLVAVTRVEGGVVGCVAGVSEGNSVVDLVVAVVVLAVAGFCDWSLTALALEGAVVADVEALGALPGVDAAAISDR